ncbi:MAG: N-acetylmuramoyl-L-alanine amidase [Micavibrio aeruginosavorus]|uniref:N-acetylmuramoyl-L-alanine amidase n=1 Tax=Micavibrio aeruginosavorus TaxID=349221 RepID=A0A2W5FN79_9BACT|nr:MAG: N-acetylmuramoyl-L-alanine amidase [Micavibrio aeruginosavorus]
MRFFLLLIPFLFFCLPAFALEVNGVRFGTHADKQRIVIELSKPAPFKAYVLENPSRIIVDLPDFSWKVGTIQKPVKSAIADIRHGNIGKGQSRIVLQANSGISILSSFILPKDSSQPSRIVIDFRPSGSSSIQANKDERPRSASTVQNLAAKFPPPVTPPKPQKAKSVAAHEAVKNSQNLHEEAFAYRDIPSFEEQPQPKNSQKPLIIIDPGHGGQDPGARAANGAYEKTIVLAVAMELKQQLLNSGQYRVQMTRDTDVFIPLKERVKFARRNGGDLFISLHADSISNSTVSGASVYTLSDTASDKEAEKLAERENKSDAIAGVNLAGQDNDVANILIDLASRDTMNQSRYLANTVVTTMPGKGVEMLSRKPHRSAGFAVLKAMDIPSILVEMGYLTNMNEAMKLSTKEYRVKVARGLKSSVDAYFTKVAKLNTP